MEDLGILYWLLARPTPEEVTPSYLMMASHATAWAGFTAVWIAPSLRNRYYLGLCVLLFVAGLSYSWYRAKSLTDPVTLGVGQILAVLRDLPKLNGSETSPSPEALPEG